MGEPGWLGLASQNEAFDITDPYRAAERGGVLCPASLVSMKDSAAHDTSNTNTTAAAALADRGRCSASASCVRALQWGEPHGMLAVIQPESPRYPLCTAERPEARRGAGTGPETSRSVNGTCYCLFRNPGTGCIHGSPVSHRLGAPTGGCSKRTVALGVLFGCGEP